MTVLLLIIIAVIALLGLCVLLAIQADIAAMRRVIVGWSMAEGAEAVEAYTRGVTDGRNLAEGDR